MEFCQSFRKMLKITIKLAKSLLLKWLRVKIHQDIWDQRYKIITKNIIGLPILRLTIHAMEKATRELFLTTPYIYLTVIINCDNDWMIFSSFITDELKAACHKLENKKAPGPGYIPSEIMKLVALGKQTITSKSTIIWHIWANFLLNGRLPN